MEFDSEGGLLYAGNFLDGLKEGYGVLYDRNGGIVFKGEFMGGLKEGAGTVFRANATIVYSGGFEQDLFKGEGGLFYRNGRLMYTGMFEENLRNGPGTEYHDNGNVGFEGQFKDNNFHGQGLLYNLDGVKLYNGMFVEGKKNGRGTEFGETRTEIYIGQFKNGLYHGRGKTFYTHKDTNKEDATYFNDFDGKFHKGIRVSGDILYRNGQTFYSGKLAQEMPDGENVTLYHENGVVQYQGSMKIGIKQGPGKSWYKNGSIKFIGTYSQNDMTHGALYSKLGKLQSRWHSQPPPTAPLPPSSSPHHPHHSLKSNLPKSILSTLTPPLPQRLDNSTVPQDAVISIGPGYKKSTQKILSLNWFKDFYPNGGLQYEGSKSGQGQYSHFGTLWYGNCSLEYTGQWGEGLRHGKGLEYYEFGWKVKVIGKWRGGRVEGSKIL